MELVITVNTYRCGRYLGSKSAPMTSGYIETTSLHKAAAKILYTGIDCEILLAIFK